MDKLFPCFNVSLLVVVASVVYFKSGAFHLENLYIYKEGELWVTAAVSRPIAQPSVGQFG